MAKMFRDDLAKAAAAIRASRTPLVEVEEPELSAQEQYSGAGSDQMKQMALGMMEDGTLRADVEEPTLMEMAERRKRAGGRS